MALHPVTYLVRRPSRYGCVPAVVKVVQRIAVLFHSVVGKTLPERQSVTA